MICIYHKNCVDGFTAATIVKQNIPEAKMIGGVHGESPPDVLFENVIIVDFSYPRDVILEMAKEALSITIIDHHKSAQKDLVDLPGNVTVFFDMQESGASLTWQHFHPAEEMPMFVQHVKDRDLWTFELEYTKEFSAGLFILGYNFDLYQRMIYEVDRVPDLMSDGASIMKKQTKDINELIASCAYRMDICGYDVPVLNVPYMYASEAGSIMCKGQPFAATYYDTEKTRKFSLRSTDGGVDVSEIAVKMGGGGHRNASGYRIDKV